MYDNRGAGYSTINETEPTISQMMLDAVRLLDVLKIEKADVEPVKKALNEKATLSAGEREVDPESIKVFFMRKLPWQKQFSIDTVQIYVLGYPQP